jgi:hypothetical protein
MNPNEHDHAYTFKQDEVWLPEYELWFVVKPDVTDDMEEAMPRVLRARYVCRIKYAVQTSSGNIKYLPCGHTVFMPTKEGATLYADH